MLVLTSCMHGPVVHEPAPMPVAVPSAPAAPDAKATNETKPATEVSHPVETPAAAAVISSSPAPAEAIEVTPADEKRIAVTSEPSGARILVNNQPVGRTPLRLAVKITVQGFCADYVTVRARFVAQDATQVSQTVDVQLTPLEKPPATLSFTTAGAQRTMK
jgi:hypothetical protein